MKRYAIVYADGSNRRLTQTDYSSRKDDCDMYVTLYEEGDDIAADDGQIKPNMPTHWMKMPTHP